MYPPSNQRFNLLAELQRAESYDPIFKALETKVQEEPRRLNTAPVERDLSLSWILRSRLKVAAHLTSELRSRRYMPGIGNLNRLVIDKPRVLLSFSWPDRLVEALIADRIRKSIEPLLSDSVYSFRCGRSNLQAIRRACAWIDSARIEKNPIFVVKRDVAQYGDSIDQAQLLILLKSALGDQDPYFWRLVEAFLRPQFRDHGNVCRSVKVGIPMGLAITPVCENLYLSELDHYFSSQKDLLYLRFGDDLLLMHSNPKVLAAHATKLEQGLNDRGLAANVNKSVSIQLTYQPAATIVEDKISFKSKNYLEYLGYRVNCSGKIFLTNPKLADLKNELRQIAKRAHYHALASGARGQKLTEITVAALNLALQPGLAPRYLQLVLQHCTDDVSLKRLDTWVAKLALRFSFRSGHDRVFRHHSLKGLRRSCGLCSLVHLKNSQLRRRPQWYQDLL